MSSAEQDRIARALESISDALAMLVQMMEEAMEDENPRAVYLTDPPRGSAGGPAKYQPSEDNGNGRTRPIFGQPGETGYPD